MSLPLGLQVDPRNSGVYDALKGLEAYDFSSITSDVQRKYSWPADHANKVELYIKRFFSLAFLDPGSYHIPKLM